MKRQEFKKKKRRSLGTPGTTLNVLIWTVGVPEGEEEEQETENLCEQIMKSFPNLVKEIDFQEVQEAQGVPKKLDPRNTHRGTS